MFQGTADLGTVDRFLGVGAANFKSDPPRISAGVFFDSSRPHQFRPFAGDADDGFERGIGSQFVDRRSGILENDVAGVGGCEPATLVTPKPET